MHSIRYGASDAQVLEMWPTPHLSANALQAIPVAGGSAASLALQDYAGNTITGYSALAPAWDSTRRCLYYSGVFPSASFPLGLGYRAIWGYVYSTSGSSPEPRQEAVTIFDVTKRKIAPMVTTSDLSSREPMLLSNSYTNSASDQASFILQAWEDLYGRVRILLRDTPDSLVDSLVLRPAHLSLSIAYALRSIGAFAQADSYRSDSDGLLKSALATAPRDPGGATGIASPQGAIAIGRVVR